MKKTIVFILFILPMFVLGQHEPPSIKVVDAEKYKSPTKWSPKDKHYGYYMAAFAMPIPIKSDTEKAFKSGYLRLGYTYRYKIIDFLDLGLELAYANRYSGTNMHIYSMVAGNDFEDYMKNPRAYFHYAEVGAFVRFNLGGATYRKLGTYLDLGFTFDYAMGYGFLHKNKSSQFKQRTRIKKPDLLSRENYGIYMRAGWNYISLFCSYQFVDLFDKDSSHPIVMMSSGGNFRSPLTVGIQLNLYSR